jgi:hypothetical protein
MQTAVALKSERLRAVEEAAEAKRQAMIRLKTEHRVVEEQQTSVQADPLSRRASASASDAGDNAGLFFVSWQKPRATPIPADETQPQRQTPKPTPPPEAGAQPSATQNQSTPTEGGESKRSPAAEEKPAEDKPQSTEQSTAAEPATQEEVAAAETQTTAKPEESAQRTATPPTEPTQQNQRKPSTAETESQTVPAETTPVTPRSCAEGETQTVSPQPLDRREIAVETESEPSPSPPPDRTAPPPTESPTKEVQTEPVISTPLSDSSKPTKKESATATTSAWVRRRWLDTDSSGSVSSTGRRAAGGADDTSTNRSYSTASTMSSRSSRHARYLQARTVRKEKGGVSGYSTEDSQIEPLSLRHSARRDSTQSKSTKERAPAAQLVEMGTDPQPIELRSHATPPPPAPAPPPRETVAIATQYEATSDEPEPAPPIRKTGSNSHRTVQQSDPSPSEASDTRRPLGHSKIIIATQRKVVPSVRIAPNRAERLEEARRDPMVVVGRATRSSSSSENGDGPSLRRFSDHNIKPVVDAARRTPPAQVVPPHTQGTESLSKDSKGSTPKKAVHPKNAGAQTIRTAKADARIGNTPPTEALAEEMELRRKSSSFPLLWGAGSDAPPLEPAAAQTNSDHRPAAPPPRASKLAAVPAPKLQSRGSGAS